MRVIVANGLFFSGCISSFVGLWQMYPPGALLAGGIAAAAAGVVVFKNRNKG